MSSMLVIVLLIFWAICGILAYGITFSYFRGNWPLSYGERRIEERVLCSLLFLLGFIGLAVSLFCSHGISGGRGIPKELKFR